MSLVATWATAGAIIIRNDVPDAKYRVSPNAFPPLVAAHPPDAVLRVPTDAVDADMSAAVAAHRVTGATLAILHGGTIVYEKAYGMRDAQKMLPATIDQVFAGRATFRRCNHSRASRAHERVARVSHRSVAPQ